MTDSLWLTQLMLVFSVVTSARRTVLHRPGTRRAASGRAHASITVVLPVQQGAILLTPWWDADEHLQAILEQHSAEEVLEELKKMESEGLLPVDTEEGVPMQFVARPGCTPFEYVNFTDETIEHDIDILVRLPLPLRYLFPPHLRRAEERPGYQLD